MNANKLFYIFIAGMLSLEVPVGAQGLTEAEKGGGAKPTMLSGVNYVGQHDAQGVPAKDVSTEWKRAWEFGIGASAFQFSRVDLTRFQKETDQYRLGLQLRHTVLGPNLYIARELTPWIYIDLQGSVGFTQQHIDGKDKTRTLYMVGPGLQWRLGEYFDSKYIDPFFRVGVSYMKKNFDMRYVGSEGELSEEMSWVLENLYNKDGADRDELLPVSLGIGMNAWLNDRFGIGLQGDYLLMPHKDVANSLQGTVRLIWRVGGKSKKRIPPMEYVEVEKIVQAPPRIVERIVEVPAPLSEAPSVELCELFNNIYFAFDKSDIRPESEVVLDRIAGIMKENSDKKYLITGYTDARGSAEYNIGLSRRRAAAVTEALESRGVPSGILKSRGVGKQVAYAPVSESHHVREGDRKVTVEIITNMDYWDILPKVD